MQAGEGGTGEVSTGPDGVYPSTEGGGLRVLMELDVVDIGLGELVAADGWVAVVAATTSLTGGGDVANDRVAHTRFHGEDPGTHIGFRSQGRVT